LFEKIGEKNIDFVAICLRRYERKNIDFVGISLNVEM
jgi:hypothetical protein